MRPIGQWYCKAEKYKPEFWNKIIEKIDDEITEEHKIADSNNNQIKKERTADKKMWNEEIDHYSNTQTKLEKKPEVYKIIKKEHFDHKKSSNEKVDNDNSKNPTNLEEEKHEEHKILEKSEDLKTKTKDLENLIIKAKRDDNQEENKSSEPSNESKKEIIDNEKLTELQKNKMVENMRKKNINIKKYIFASKILYS